MENSIHGDIKPANILVSYEKNRMKACVGDFGLSGKSGGTPIFMAPEGLGKDSRIIGKTDLYSFAMTALFLIFPIDLCLKLLYVPISSKLKVFRDSLGQLPILYLIFQTLQSNPSIRPDYHEWKDGLTEFEKIEEKTIRNKTSTNILNQFGVDLEPLNEAEKDDITMIAIESFFNFDSKLSSIQKLWQWTRAQSHMNSLSLNTMNLKSKAISKSKIC